MKKYIKAMANSKKDVAAQLEQGTDELIMHLIKLRIYSMSDSKMHWRKEVAEKLHRTDLLKGSHKIPSADFIFNNTYGSNQSLINHYIDVVIDNYGDPDHIVDRSALIDDIKEYFLWISEQLSVHRIISYRQIHDKLEELGF